jgi:hypothetical protein
VAYLLHTLFILSPVGLCGGLSPAYSVHFVPFRALWWLISCILCTFCHLSGFVLTYLLHTLFILSPVGLYGGLSPAYSVHFVPFRALWWLISDLTHSACPPGVQYGGIVLAAKGLCCQDEVGTRGATRPEESYACLCIRVLQAFVDVHEVRHLHTPLIFSPIAPRKQRIVTNDCTLLFSLQAPNPNQLQSARRVF